MDGTLIDSEPSWIKAEMDLAARFGVEWTHEDGMTLVGRPLPDSAQILRARGINLEPAELIDSLIAAVAQDVGKNVPWIAPARELLHLVNDAGIPCALVTMSQGAFVDTFLAAAGPVFDVVVTGDQVTRGKPDPEAYLKAADLLGVEIGECIAFEDSDPGTRAAHASGAVTVGVRSHMEIPRLEGMSRVSTLEGFTMETLSRLLHGEVIDTL